MVTIYLFVYRVGNKNIMQKTYLVILFNDIPDFLMTSLIFEKNCFFGNENVMKFLSCLHFPHKWTCLEVTIIGISLIAIHMPATFLWSHTLLANWCQGVHTQFENYSHFIIIQVVTWFPWKKKLKSKSTHVPRKVFCFCGICYPNVY